MWKMAAYKRHAVTISEAGQAVIGFFWFYGVGRVVNRTSPSVFRRLCIFREHGERIYIVSSALEL